VLIGRTENQKTDKTFPDPRREKKAPLREVFPSGPFENALI
jgi:hypothetical protein